MCEQMLYNIIIIFQVVYEKLFLETCAVTPANKGKIIDLLNQGVDPNVEVTNLVNGWFHISYFLISFRIVMVILV